MRNPWASRTTTDVTEIAVRPVADSRYAAPSGEGAYIDEQGWSPSLRLSPETIPDTHRLGTFPLIDHRPNPARPPEEFFGKNARDISARHSVEAIDADGWTEVKGVGSERRFAPNPRETPPPESRLTQQMAPRSYSFFRPFAGPPRALNGEHFSMADHRRTYEILGMAPQRKPGAGTRNTYRLTPEPWDVDIVDVPPDVSPDIPYGRVQAVEVIPQSKRAMRLS